MLRITIIPMLLTAASFSDIPDYTLEWDMMQIYEFDGSAEVEDFTASQRGTDFRVLCSVHSGGSTGVWILELSSEGAVLNRSEIASDVLSGADWVLPRFLTGNTVMLVYGTEEGEAGMSVLDMGCPSNSSDVPLEEISSGSVYLKVTAAEPSNSGVIIAGETVTEGYTGTFFVACINSQGEILWKNDLGSGEVGCAETCLLPLQDGGCILSNLYDVFPSDIYVHRLNGEGESLWSIPLGFECDLHASINGFAEMENGDVICTGSYDPPMPDQFRGITVCLDPAGGEVWRSIDWYMDHTSFKVIFDCHEDGLALAGWTGIAGEYMLEVQDRDALIAIMQIPDGRMVGFSVREDGDQIPAAAVSLEQGGFLVMGEHIPENSEDSDIFMGRVFPEL